MPVLGSVAYEFDASSRPLVAASREAIKAFEDVDKAAKKADTSIKGVTKSHSALGGAIKGAIGVGGAVGVGLLTKHMLEGTKAGDSLNKVLGQAAGHLRTFGGHLSEGLRPFRAWLTSTETGSKAITTFEKGVAKAGEGFQKFDQGVAKGAGAIKGWVTQGQQMAKAGDAISRSMAGARGVVTGLAAAVSQGGQQFKAWAHGADQAGGATGKLGQTVSGAKESVGKFGSSFKPVLGYLNDVGEGMTAVELGALGMTGNLGKAAVVATHFSDMLGMVGGGLALMGGKIGILGAVISTASAGVSGLTGLLGGLVSAAGMVAEALGERLLAKTEVWIERFAEAQVTVLGFSRAVKAYNETIKDTPVATAELEKWMSKLSVSTGTATVDIRQATLRALELSKVTGLTTDQVEQLTERSVDLASAMHRDLWDAVWSVLDAMRGFPMMASGFGIALDQETLKTSEFTKALGGTYEGLTEFQKNQVMFQELMKQSAWSAGIAAEQLGTTLVGATRKSEQAFSRLHVELGKGAAVVWQPYTNVVAEAVSTFNLIPATVVQAYGTITALGGVALTTVGSILKLAGSVVTFNVAIMAITHGFPLLSKGLIWLTSKVFGMEKALVSMKDVIKLLTLGPLLAFGSIIKNTAATLLSFIWTAGKFTIFGKVGLIIAGVTLAVYGLVKAYKALFPTMQDNIDAAHKEVLATGDRIKALNSLKFTLENSKKSEAELREEILKISKDYPAFLELLNKEKLAREDIVKAIEETVKKEKEKKSAKEGEALASITKELQAQKVELSLIGGERKKLLGQLDEEEKRRKEVQQKGTWLQRAAIDSGSYAANVSHINKQLEYNAKAEAKVRKEISDLEKELQKIVGVRKIEQKTVATTADLAKKLAGLTQQEANDVREASSIWQESYGIIQDVYQRRFALIDESRERERAAAESSRDLQQDVLNKVYEYESVVLKQREAAHAAYDASLIQNVRKSTAGTVQEFLSQSGAYFDELQKFEKDNLNIHLRALSALKAGASTFADAYRGTATVVFNEIKTGSEESVKALEGFYTEATKKWEGAGQIGLRAVQKQQAALTEGSRRAILIMSKDFAGASETIQQAYAKISGSQENYLGLLLRAGPATQDIAATTVQALKETDKAFSAQIAEVKALTEEYKKYEKEQQAIDQLDLKVMNLRRQRLEAFAKVFAKAYEDMAARQRSLMSQQEADLQKLRSLEEEKLQRSSEMEKVFRELQIKSGEITMSEWEQWYADMGDLDAKFGASRRLAAEERAKIDQGLIASYLGMVKEIQDAQGNVVISEKEAAETVRKKLIPVWEDEKAANKLAAAQVSQDMDTRKKDIAELGKSMEVAKAGMVGLQEEHRKLSDAISKTEHKIAMDMEDKVTGKLENIKTLLKAVTDPRKIDLQVDWKNLAAMQAVFKNIEQSLSRIGQLSDIAAGKAPRPTPPATPAPAPTPPAAGPKPVVGAPGEISTRGFQQGGMVQALQEGGLIEAAGAVQIPRGRKGALGARAGKAAARKDPRVLAILKVLEKVGVHLKYQKAKELFDKGDQVYEIVKAALAVAKTSRALPVPINIPSIALTLTADIMKEQQELFDKGLQQGGQVTGKIPGYGGGDKVPIAAFPGQFVIRKEAVQKYGSGLLAALSQVPDGKLGGFQPKQKVPVAVEPGEFVVPREAVAARGLGFFEQINRIQIPRRQAGGSTPEVTAQELSAAPSWMTQADAASWVLRHRKIGVGSAFAWSPEVARAFAGVTAPGDAAQRIDIALRYAGVMQSNLSNRLEQADRLLGMFRSAGGYLSKEEFKKVKVDLQNSGRDPNQIKATLGILRKFVGDSPEEITGRLTAGNIGRRKAGKMLADRGMNPWGAVRDLYQNGGATLRDAAEILSGAGVSPIEIRRKVFQGGDPVFRSVTPKGYEQTERALKEEIAQLERRGQDPDKVAQLKASLSALRISRVQGYRQPLASSWSPGSKDVGLEVFGGIPTRLFSSSRGSGGSGRRFSAEVIPGIARNQLLPSAGRGSVSRQSIGLFGQGGLVRELRQGGLVDVRALASGASQAAAFRPPMPSPRGGGASVVESARVPRHDTLDLVFKVEDRAYPLRVEGSKNIEVARLLSQELSRARLVGGG